MKFAERSMTYRKEYFKNNKPVKDDKYRCVYCGYLYSKKEITIDHLYAVHRAKKSPFVRFILKLRGYTSINDIRNLVPACDKCNKIKGKKGGLWILKGILGKSEEYWMAKKAVFWVMIITLIVLIYKTDAVSEIIKFIRR